jgi:hypothetical protein
MKRAGWMLLPLSLVCATGCVPLFYAYPAVSYVPGINMGPSHTDAHVFRVDATEETAAPGHCRLRELPPTPGGRVYGQADTALDEGFYWNCLVYRRAWQTSHTLRVRAYRPGFTLIEICAWQGTAGIQWQPAKTVAAQEQAIDGLVAPTALATVAAEPDAFAHLDPGSASPSHRAALLFAAGEYDRLASRVDALEDESAEICDRLMSKAKQLRELAER